MFAITGATGNVGGAMAHALLDAGEAVRVVLRDAAKADTWRGGMRNPLPRMRMLDGFNEGWLAFDRTIPMRRGTTSLADVVARLAA